ncbi:MAG: hypothetical protein Q7R83_00325 [bacterium]|nr:hypothetical protein [bacterium]
MKHTRLIYFIGALPWVAVIIILGWLFLLRFPLGGVRTFSFPFDGTQPWLQPFSPTERVTVAGPQDGGWIGQRIIGDPVYATAQAPGVFDRVTVTLVARPTGQPTVAIGLLRDPHAWAIELHPVFGQGSEPEMLADGWYRFTTTFALSYPQDQLKFVLSAPGIASRQGMVEIRSVDLRYERPRFSASEFWRVLKREIFLIRERL